MINIGKLPNGSVDDQSVALLVTRIDRIPTACFTRHERMTSSQRPDTPTRSLSVLPDLPQRTAPYMIEP